VIVGVNRFAVADEEPYEPLRVDPAIEQDQARRLAALRAARDAAEVTRQLDEIRRAAAGTGNLLYPLREALRARATVGEVCDALREIWGSYQPPDVY
jgi:methylmalonyl-CoA mutase N-terminal domain/subunit